MPPSSNARATRRTAVLGRGRSSRSAVFVPRAPCRGGGKVRVVRASPESPTGAKWNFQLALTRANATPWPAWLPLPIARRDALKTQRRSPCRRAKRVELFGLKRCEMGCGRNLSDLRNWRNASRAGQANWNDQMPMVGKYQYWEPVDFGDRRGAHISGGRAGLGFIGSAAAAVRGMR
jgi:hypothetical protein